MTRSTQHDPAVLIPDGITVRHFTPRQIRTEPGTVIAAIRSALAAAASRPRLPIRTITA
jgi:hypothetical protein